jgi:YVTN family beta-propeller protein
MRSKVAMAIAAIIASLGSSEVRAQSLIVVNQGNATVSLVDPKTFTVTAQIEEKQAGKIHAHEAAVSPDGKTAYVPVYGDTGIGVAGIDGHNLLFIDLPTRTITGSLNFGHGVRPHQAVVDPNTGLLYVTTEKDKSIAVIDPKARAILGSVPTGAENSHMMVLSHDGRFGYTANVKPGSVSVLDMTERKTLAVIPIADVVQRIAISSDDKLVFTSDNTKPRLAVIETATRSFRDWIDLPGLGYGAAATKDGRWLLIAIPSTNAVGVIDLTTMKVARTISVGNAPQEILIQPDGRLAYVSCAGSGFVTAIDLATWTAVRDIPTAAGADGLAWAIR